MTRARPVLLILFLLAGSLPPPQLWGQSAESAPYTADDGQAFVLEQNFPEQANPETWIPFQLNPSLFQRTGEVTATIRIINILNQAIAIPEAVDHPGGVGTRVINLTYTEPGRKLAFWDGKTLDGREVPTGVYYIHLTVDGLQPQVKKFSVLNPRRRRSIFPW